MRGGDSAGVRFAVLGISIRTPSPKQHKLEKRLEERKRGKALQCGSRCFTATVTPWRDEDLAKKKGKEGGLKNERAEGKGESQLGRGVL